MGLVYVALGLAITAVLHVALTRFNRLNRPQRLKFKRWFGIAAALSLGLMLLRFGLPYIGAALGGLAVLFSNARRLIPFLPFFQRLWSRRRGASSRQPRNNANAMSAEEARAMLGVGPQASREEIKAAYHRLMQKCHPDQGGSDYLAAQLNAAKEILLNHDKTG